MTEKSNEKHVGVTRKAVSINTRISRITTIIVTLLIIMGYVAYRFGNDSLFMAMFISASVVAFFALIIAAILKDKEEKMLAANKKNVSDSNSDTDN